MTAICLCVSLLLAFGCTPVASSNVPEQTLSLYLFDTHVLVRANCSADVMDKVQDRCEFFESTLSRTVEGSDVWEINHAQGRPVQVTPETALCVQKACELSKLTEGAFDITVGAASSLWDFSTGTMPSRDKALEATHHIDFENILVEGEIIQLLDSQAQIDLGGIAKGFIADDLIRLLKDEGCQQALIDLGGCVYALGGSGEKPYWVVGVSDPGQPEEMAATIQASDKAVVTSGLGQRSFFKDGGFYHHILDPKTGYPVLADIASATIVSEDAAKADALATAAFVLGGKAAIALLDRMDGVDYALVTSEGEMLTPGNTRFVQGKSNSAESALSAVIHKQDGSTQSVSLSENATFDVSSKLGTNTVQVKDGKIRVQSADCPNQICVQQGWISQPGQQIVCLPHQAWIEVVHG